MKSIHYFMLCGALLGSMASAAPSLSRDDLAVYYDFTKVTGTGGGARLGAVIAPVGSQFNPCLGNGNVFSSTGGYQGKGYIASDVSNFYSPSCENLQGAGIAYASQGMAFSVKVRDIGSAGISLNTWFSGGTAGDASFLISGNSLSTPSGAGFGNSYWTMAAGRKSITAHTDVTIGNLSALGSAPWQSLTVSVATTGIVSIYVDGSLFATSTAAWDRMAGNLKSIRLGANGENTSARGDGQFSDFAIWDKALTADDAAWLANNGTNALLPEPATASLALLGFAAFGLRRRRTL